ncbi:MAG: LptF/LptG family permease [Chthoniobacteraceae bacterium]|nr:LptF/LptG family permease [Chthoniobacteraceae bacterium]
MILLDRYILRSFLTPFLLCFFGFLSIWLVFDLQSNTSDFIEAHVSLRWVVVYYLTQVPQFMMICIPVGLLLALLFCLSKMSRSNEIISMLTAGQSLPRLLLPLVLVGLVLTGVCAALNYTLAPHSDSIKRELRNGISKKPSKARTLTSQLFRNRPDRRTWYVTSMPAKADDPDPLLQGVDILEQNETGAIVARWFAFTARYRPETKKWLFFNGKTVQFGADGTLLSSKPFQTLEINNWSETPWRIASSNLDPQGLSVAELQEYLKNNADFPKPQLAPYATHLQYRWALPFQCLAVVLFTGPLAIVFSRRGVLSGIAGAIFLFAGMTFFTFLMLAFGKGNRISPTFATWSPLLLFGGIGLYLLYLKATNREFPKLADLFAPKPKIPQ